MPFKFLWRECPESLRTHLIKARVLDVGLVPTVTFKRGRWYLLFSNGRSWIIRSCHTPCFLWVMDVRRYNTLSNQGVYKFAKFLTGLFLHEIHPSKATLRLDQCNQQVSHAGKQRHLLRLKYCTSLLSDFHPTSLGVLTWVELLCERLTIPSERTGLPKP